MEIEGYSNYLIYDDGRVWTKYYNKFMKPCLDSNGYYRICLINNKKKNMLSIHRLIAMHYIDNPNGYETVDHIDNNRINNNINNLRWASYSMQNLNKIIKSNTGEKYITKSKVYWRIEKKKCFNTSLLLNQYTLQDAINLRDSLLGE